MPVGAAEGAMLGMRRRAVNEGALNGDRKVGAPPPNESPNLQPVFLRGRWDNTVQAQVLYKLSVVVGNVPDRNDRDTEFGVRCAIAAFHSVEGVFRCERGENTIGVVEGILEILDQLGFGFCRIVPALFAVVGWLLALKFVEEGELSAGDVLHLFAEAADAIEPADCGD